jgi:hypothetical protein
MSYKYTILKDNPIGFWPVITTSASDYSGCGNDGTIHGVMIPSFPLARVGQGAIKITDTKYVNFAISNDYTGSASGGSIADKYSLDNDFSLEVWFYPPTSTSLVPIFADATNSIGIFYENGDIRFDIDSEVVRYTLPFINKSHYIVAAYSVNNIYLYCDGIQVAQKELDNKPGLTNTSLTLSCGPALDSSHPFVIHAPSVYRYALSPEQVYAHYIASQEVNPIQIADPDGGTLFRLSDENLRKVFSYSYPYKRKLDSFIDDNLYYDKYDNSLNLIPVTPGPQAVTITDFISIPTQIGLVTSKIEWLGSNGITVETSTDNTTWETCVSGENVPQYSINSFDTSGNLYIRINLESTNGTYPSPKLTYFNISFFTNKNVYAENGGEYIDFVDGDYFLGSLNYDVLSRHKHNGLRMAPFKITTTQDISSMEVIYTYGGTGSLISTSGTSYSWNQSGVITKSNISSIWVNGVDKTSQTSISNVFSSGEPHHVVINFTSSITDEIAFNTNGTGTYKNLTLYPTTLTQTQISEHYDLYTSRLTHTITDDYITVTENTPDLYDNDWVLVQKV